jgi:carbon monoxide dehydrogenase subunit G
MPEAKLNLVIDAPTPKVWQLLSNPIELASCMPNVVDVQVLDNETWLWKLRGQLGPISKTFSIKVKAEKEPPNRITFTGEGDDVRLKGHLNLRPSSPNQTTIESSLQLESGRGIIGLIVNQWLENNIDEQAREFANAVKRKLAS